MASHVVERSMALARILSAVADEVNAGTHSDRPVSFDTTRRRAIPAVRLETAIKRAGATSVPAYDSL